MAVGRSTSFEVTVNGEVIWSKLTSGGFPNEDEVVEQVINAEKGEKMGTVTAAKSSCTIL